MGIGRLTANNGDNNKGVISVGELWFAAWKGSGGCCTTYRRCEKPDVMVLDGNRCICCIDDERQKRR